MPKDSDLLQQRKKLVWRLMNIRVNIEYYDNSRSKLD